MQHPSTKRNPPKRIPLKSAPWKKKIVNLCKNNPDRGGNYSNRGLERITKAFEQSCGLLCKNFVSRYAHVSIISRHYRGNSLLARGECLADRQISYRTVGHNESRILASTSIVANTEESSC